MGDFAKVRCKMSGVAILICTALRICTEFIIIHKLYFCLLFLVILYYMQLLGIMGKLEQCCTFKRKQYHR